MSPHKRFPGLSLSIEKCCVRGLTFVVMALVTTGLSNVAHGEKSEGGTFYCTTQITSGIAFDSSTNNWVATTFKPTEKFVLKLRYLGREEKRPFQSTKSPGDPDDLGSENEALRKRLEGEVWTRETYSVSMIAEGSRAERPCLPEIVAGPTIRCEASHIEISFNPATNRFLTAYREGYVGGNDNNENTPSISAGVCTKIN